MTAQEHHTEMTHDEVHTLCRGYVAKVLKVMLEDMNDFQVAEADKVSHRMLDLVNSCTDGHVQRAALLLNALSVLEDMSELMQEARDKH